MSTPATMRAIVIEAPGRIALRELPLPDPGPYQALCRMRYGAICAGTDQHLIAGDAPFRDWFRMPAVLGHESVGEVIAPGERARGLKPGDLVIRVGTTPVGGVGIAWGGFAEYGIATDWAAMRDDGLPAAEWDGARPQRVLPPGTDPAAATLLVTWRETLSYARRLGVGPGQRVLVIGSGGNGLAFAAHARHLGASATVIGSAARAGTAAAVGARLLDYRARLEEPLSEAGPFDALIDSLGDRATSERCLGALRAGATVGVYGFDAPWDPAVLTTRGLRPYAGGYDEAETHDEVMALWRAGRLDPGQWVAPAAEAFPLERFAEALEAVRARRLVKPLIRLG